MMPPCKELFDGAFAHRIRTRVNPVRIYPACHPKSYIEAYVDSKHNRVILCCGACDQVISRIKVKLRKSK